MSRNKKIRIQTDISITLWNRGDNAFRANVYGDSIVVQQHISVNGSRSYKLKSEKGTVFSTRKEELMAILDHFNIQVDKPVSVLTQEMALKKDDEQLCKRIEELKKSTDQSLEPERLERQRRICWLKEKVQALQDQESTVNQEAAQFEQAIEKDKQEHVRIKREDLNVLATLQRNKDENKKKNISEIRELENMEENQSVDIATLEDEAEENKIKMQMVEKNMEQQKNMENLKSLKIEAENKYDTIKLKINQLSELADPLKDELNLADSEVDSQKQRKQHHEDKQKEHLDTLNKKRRELDMKEKELQEKMSQARQNCQEWIDVKKIFNNSRQRN
ncbi:structural maintenance of chromosomes protein 6 [Cricetulus griseus]|uniref:Structural maintenance of chromosomes protein 6 n=2 Tax=Cricetulus griseus TaxID=10029 RepID=A0A061IJ22_CRIGR|nr:structural maintenance of chromosomes protein 6 [Cricetulus griseus]